MKNLEVRELQSNLPCERECVEKAQNDPRAFRYLYDSYFSKVYAYVSYRVGRVQDTEDITSEIFLKAMVGITRLEWQHENSFAGWIFCIAHNTVNDFYRKNQPFDEPLSLEELPELRASVLLPEDALLRKEKFAQLRQLIDALPSRRQEVILLKFFGRLRNQEIAKILGLDERTIASHLFRALVSLHREYIINQSNRTGGKEETS
jgi:RNA polymerase sigma-70 factor (ECF subfamily)